MINLDTFDPTDANAGAEAAERANALEGALKDLVEATRAQRQLAEVRSDGGHYRGHGLTALVDAAAKLPAALCYAIDVLEAQKKPIV